MRHYAILLHSSAVICNNILILSDLPVNIDKLSLLANSTVKILVVKEPQLSLPQLFRVLLQFPQQRAALLLPQPR